MVNYITLTQTISRLFTGFSPSADGCNIDFTPVGEANNWECVDDPIATPDEDTTYVHSTITDLQYDLYEIPDHTTEEDRINYVQVYARSKSHEHAQHADGIFKIILTDNDCTNIYKSDDINLTTEYVTYDNTWTENPRTSTEWTWSDIDNLQVGEECTSPSISIPIGSEFRPDSDININLSSVDCDPPSQHDCVNYVIPPDTWEGCVVNQSADPAVTLADTFGIPNHNPATQYGAISNVRFYWRIRMYKSHEAETCTGKAVLIDTVNVNNNETALNFTEGWVTTYVDYAVNPATSLAWTWAEIDGAQLKIEMTNSWTSGSWWSAAYCNNLYIVVSHMGDVSPEIRTTQVYAKVNYSTHCTLTAPEEVSDSHSQNVKMLNLWNGERIVFGLSRNKWGLVLTGREWYSGACDRIICVRDLGLDDLPITIAGLNNINWDGDWRILSFGWKIISECPEHIEWILELEKYE